MFQTDQINSPNKHPINYVMSQTFHELPSCHALMFYVSSHRIKINSRSMTAAYLDKQPHLLGKWSNLNPLGRIGRPDELRGVVTWLASDASTFCTGSEYVFVLFYVSLEFLG